MISAKKLISLLPESVLANDTDKLKKIHDHILLLIESCLVKEVYSLDRLHHSAKIKVSMSLTDGLTEEELKSLASGLSVELIRNVYDHERMIVNGRLEFGVWISLKVRKKHLKSLS